MNQLTIIHEDNHLLVINKPAGLLSQGDHSGDLCLVDLAKADLKQRYQKPGNVYLGLVHRLDRNTSGVMVLAKTSKAAGRLAAQFREKTITKFYRAVVQGQMPGKSGDLKSYLAAKGDAQGITQAKLQPFPGSHDNLHGEKMRPVNFQHPLIQCHSCWALCGRTTTISGPKYRVGPKVSIQ